MKTQNHAIAQSSAFDFLVRMLARRAAERARRRTIRPFSVPDQLPNRAGCRQNHYVSPSRFTTPNRPRPFRRFFDRSNPLWIAVVALVMFAIAPARADWPNTNGTKFVQLPDTSTNGMDINLKNYPVILADDFICTNTGPISDIHLWLSSLQNLPATSAQFELSIWSDVPADPAAGTLSHPGVRLWSEVFSPGDYAIVVAKTNLQETFWDLDPTPVFMGPDNTLFLYNFYPKQPYTQTGTTTNPVVYWLGVSMTQNDPLQGWKTSTNHFGPDAAVLGHYTGITNVTDWKTLFDPRKANVGLDFSFALTTRPPTNPPPVECVETNTVKFIQPPRSDAAWDVWDNGPWVLADDFLCTDTGPITDIHLWGSWLNDIVDPNPTFWIGIYDDVPATTNGPTIVPSRPGTNLVWQQYFSPGQYAQTFVGVGAGQLLDPGPPNPIGPDSKVYYYCFYPTNPPVQTGTPNNPKIYWLAVYTIPSVPGGAQFGWRQSLIQQFDISTHTTWPGSAPITTAWPPTRDPNNIAIDLAFKITTDTNQPPPQCCPETNGVKFLQRPNVTPAGLDVNASLNLMLADDFRCTNTGAITDLHLWGSWLSDDVDTNAVFTLAIWSDVPAQTNATGILPSHPGMQLWSQTFAPGQYSQCPYATTSEQFYDASLPAIMGPDTQIYYYCFFPTTPMVQRGTAAAPTNYWLSVNVQTTAGTPRFFGWHTSTDYYNDTAVWGNAPAPAAWNPMYDPQGLPISLAFKITTATNGCPPPVIICPTNKTVECGTTWDFDLPSASSSCCTNIDIVVLNTTTNGVCPTLITRTWLITDCLSNIANCSQTITIVDTTPPVLTCPTNKMVECGSIWDFDPPTVSDNCCTNAAALTVWGTVTNGSCPKFITRTWIASDCCGNTNMCSQTVTVIDTTPPVINCPTNIVVTTCDTNAIVFWPVLATDNCSSNVTVWSTPPPGTPLPWGTNLVEITAVDACGNTNTCDFSVIVERPILTLHITHGPGTVTLTWTDGTLQEATSLFGPWSDVPLATSPYTTSTGPPHKFYRLRCP